MKKLVKFWWHKVHKSLNKIVPNYEDTYATIIYENNIYMYIYKYIYIYIYIYTHIYIYI